MARRKAWPVGQCRVCLGWGEKPPYADCVTCSSWRHLHPEQAPCRHCGHVSHLNTDGLCRLCPQVIRTFDAEWIADPVAERPCQLALILLGVRLPRSQPIDRPLKGRPRDASRPRSWLDRQRIASAGPSDDPRVCPPAVRGRLPLFRPRRQLAKEHVRRIRDRDLADYDRLQAIAIAQASEQAPAAGAVCGAGVSRASLMADLAAANERDARLAGHITLLESRLAQLMGEQVFAEAGPGAPESVERLQQRIVQLEQEQGDMELRLDEAGEDLEAARAANRELTRALNQPG